VTFILTTFTPITIVCSQSTVYLGCNGSNLTNFEKYVANHFLPLSEFRMI